MPSLTEILKKMFGIDNPLDATEEQLEIASSIMQKTQKKAFEDPETRSAWGFEGETPEEQRKIDEGRGPVSPQGSGETKG